MKTVRPFKQQTWYDISIQETGNVFNAPDIARANNCSATDDLPQSIIIPDGLPTSTKELQYFRTNEIVPATGIRLMPYIDDYELPNEFPMSF